MNPKFAETKLASRFGVFNIRVYEAAHNRETVVLWPVQFQLIEPVLTRVHSECLTGDVFGSLHCDCGQQLARSMRIISQQGGILIYLRQEGRGIGLFEKIKSYKLQHEGYDTFEANLKLGHKPDLRTYEMVATALRDLGINKIKLLTNNPSKISDIASLGIKVLEIVNLVVRSNKYNRKYLNTKRKKFSHFYSKEPIYQYQFYASGPECIKEVGCFLKDKTIDPLLRICASISLDRQGLNNKKRIAEISQMLDVCREFSAIRPVLHFSCSDNEEIGSDLQKIRGIFPLASQIQINDLMDIQKLIPWENLLSAFEIDLPISSLNFDLIRTSKIKRLIKKYQWRVILDDSKGNGKAQDISVLQQQIGELLQEGINKIGLAGGFGPDALDRYFHLKRYYRINFSVDSETNVKTGKKTDVKKVKLYLTQLLRSDNPKNEGIAQTKSFLKKNRRLDWEEPSINGIPFLIHPNVFHAGQFPSSAWFANELLKEIKDCSSFCEVGCGSGVISCLLANSNPLLKVVATDINSDASENTRLNAEKLGLSKRISVRQGDVLDSIKENEKFDLIFWALPFGFLDPGEKINLEEAQVFDPGYRAVRKFLQAALAHLTIKGRVLLGFSTDLGHFDLLQSIATEAGLSCKVISKTRIQEDANLRFEIIEFFIA